MMRVLPFKAEDLALLELKPGQQREADIYGDPGPMLAAAGNAFSVWSLGGETPRPLFCGGAIERHDQYATCWAAFSIHVGRVPAYVTRRARTFVASLPHRRVDANVAATLPGGGGWARLLGFTLETVIADYFPDGTDMLVFRRAL